MHELKPGLVTIVAKPGKDVPIGTPVASSLVLLATGLAGLAGMAKRRFAR
jgi:hypothetical protein